MTSTEERYLSASNSSNLKVDADKHGDADVMIASGWSASRIGGALMRLHTKPTRDNLALVHTQVAIEADRLNLNDPGAIASSVLAWWLNRVCSVCHGRKLEVIANTPSLSDIECPSCHGSGERKIPHGSVGKRLASWLDECKLAHVDIIKRRLHRV